MFMKRSENMGEFIDDVSVKAYPEKAEMMKRSLMLAAVMCANAQLVGPELDNVFGEDEEPYTPLMWAYDLVDRCSEFVRDDKMWEKRYKEAQAKEDEEYRKKAEAKAAAEKNGQEKAAKENGKAGKK